MKLSSLLLSIGFLHWMGASEAAGRSLNNAFAPRKIIENVNKENSSYLKIRGGAGPLDPTQFAKAAIVMEAAQGLVSKTAPSLTNQKYGFSSNPLNHWAMESFGTSVVSVCAMLYCLVFKDISLEAAVQISLLPWVLFQLGNVLNKKASSLGFQDEGQVLSLFINVFMMFAATQDWATTAFKCFVVWLGVNGVLLSASPENGAKAWGKDTLTLTGDSEAMIRIFGFSTMAYAMLLGSMVFFDNTALTAFGHVEVVWFVYHVVALFIAGDIEKYGIPQGPMVFWMLFHAALAATILL